MFHRVGMQVVLVEGLDESLPMLLQICEGAGDHGLLNAARLGGGALGIAFLPSTDGAFDGVDVPQEKELALSLQRGTHT